VPGTFERHTAVSDVAREWDDLCDRVGAMPWVRSGWIDAWWRAFGRGTLELVLLRRDGRPAAAAPLVRRRGALRSATNWHTPAYELPAEDDDALAELAHELYRGVRSVELRFLAAGVPRLREAARARGWPTTERVVLRSPYVPAEGTFDEYVGSLSRSRRTDLRRQRRRLTEHCGEVELELFTTPEEAEAHLEEAFRLEGSGWKTDDGTAILSRPDTTAFYADVVRWAASEGTLRLAFLSAGGTRVAVEIGILAQRSFHVLKSGYDVEYRNYGPGMLLQASLLEWVWAEGLRGYELLGDADRYKLEWTPHVHERVLLHAFSRSVAGAAERLAVVHGRPLAKRALAAVGR